MSGNHSGETGTAFTLYLAGTTTTTTVGAAEHLSITAVQASCSVLGPQVGRVYAGTDSPGKRVALFLGTAPGIRFRTHKTLPAGQTPTFKTSTSANSEARLEGWIA